MRVGVCAKGSPGRIPGISLVCGNRSSSYGIRTLSNFHEQNPYVFDFDVDANSSQSDDTKSVDEQIVEILKIHAENPGIDVSLQRSGYRLDTGELWKQYLMDKVRNWEKVVVPIAPGEAAGQGAADPMALQEIMQQYGLDEKSALFFLQLRDQGMTDEQIIQYLQQGATA